jgi:hypothetical protein
MSSNVDPDTRQGGSEQDRRSFLAACGKYSLTVPPVMTVLLSTSLTSPAMAKSGGSGTIGGKGLGQGQGPKPKTYTNPAGMPKGNSQAAHANAPGQN